MNKSIEIMMREHKLIVGVLASLQALADKLAAGETVAREDVADFGRFFRDFADQCHHGKEEDRLFVQMVEAGMPRDRGPIAVMLAEHDAGRQEVRGLIEVGAGAGPLSESERARVVDYARRFVPLLSIHIHKEDHILYPMAQETIPAPAFAALDQACEDFDRQVRQQLDVPGLEDLAARLMERYPACLGQLSDDHRCGACSAAG